MVNSNFDRLPHAPEFAEAREDPLDGFELSLRAVAWRASCLLVGLAFLALIWLGAATVYGWITR